jgi:hypothetical protein
VTRSDDRSWSELVERTLRTAGWAPRRRVNLDSLAGSTAGQLYPIGEERDGHASLAMDVPGTVYMLFNNQIKRIGPGATALARLIEGEEAPDGE